MDVWPLRLFAFLIAPYSNLLTMAKVQVGASGLTDSAIMSSSASRGLLWPLCCFLDAWFFFGDAKEMGLDVERLAVFSKLGERFWAWYCWTGGCDEDDEFDLLPSTVLGNIEVMVVDAPPEFRKTFQSSGQQPKRPGYCDIYISSGVDIGRSEVVWTSSS